MPRELPTGFSYSKFQGTPPGVMVPAGAAWAQGAFEYTAYLDVQCLPTAPVFNGLGVQEADIDCKVSGHFQWQITQLGFGGRGHSPNPNRVVIAASPRLPSRDRVSGSVLPKNGTWSDGDMWWEIPVQVFSPDGVNWKKEKVIIVQQRISLRGDRLTMSKGNWSETVTIPRPP